MREYHDPEGLASIGMPQESPAEMHFGLTIVQNFNTMYGSNTNMIAVNRYVINPKNLNDKQPDIVFYTKNKNNEPDTALVVVEIDNEEVFTKGYKYEKASRKPQEVVALHLMRNAYIREGFAYNIETETWYRIIREADKDKKETGEKISITDKEKTEIFLKQKDNSTSKTLKMSLQELHDENPIMEIYSEIGNLKKEMNKKFDEMTKLILSIKDTGGIGKAQTIQKPLIDEDEYEDVYKSDNGIM